MFPFLVYVDYAVAEAAFGWADDPGSKEGLHRLLGIIEPAPFDLTAALRFAGFPFRRGKSDGWIAAHTLALGLVLVTNNEDFADVPGPEHRELDSRVSWAAHPHPLPGNASGPLGHSLAGRALEEIWSLETVQIRDFADRHRSVDDTPAGGGAGMVMRADVLARAVDHVLEQRPGRTRRR